MRILTLALALVVALAGTIVFQTPQALAGGGPTVMSIDMPDTVGPNQEFSVRVTLRNPESYMVQFDGVVIHRRISSGHSDPNPVISTGEWYYAYYDTPELRQFWRGKIAPGGSATLDLTIWSGQQDIFPGFIRGTFIITSQSAVVSSSHDLRVSTSASTTPTATTQPPTAQPSLTPVPTTTASPTPPTAVPTATPNTNLPVVRSITWAYNQMSVLGDNLWMQTDGLGSPTVTLLRENGTELQTITAIGYWSQGLTLRIGVVPYDLRGSLYVNTPRGKSNTIPLVPSAPVCPSNIASTGSLVGGGDNEWERTNATVWTFTRRTSPPSVVLFSPYTGELSVPEQGNVWRVIPAGTYIPVPQTARFTCTHPPGPLTPTAVPPTQTSTPNSPTPAATSTPVSTAPQITSTRRLQNNAGQWMVEINGTNFRPSSTTNLYSQFFRFLPGGGTQLVRPEHAEVWTNTQIQYLLPAQDYGNVIVSVNGVQSNLYPVNPVTMPQNDINTNQPRLVTDTWPSEIVFIRGDGPQPPTS